MKVSFTQNGTYRRLKVSNENLPDLVDFICLRLGSIKVMRCYRYRGYSVLHTDINVKLLASSVKEFNEIENL